jgi:hypothetical protein
MSDNILVGVTWLYRASKLVNHDLGIKNEIDFISTVFRYFSSEQTKKQVQGDK